MTDIVYASDFIICLMLCYSNGTANKKVIFKNNDEFCISIGIGKICCNFFSFISKTG